jgi:ADP-ribose pyrophosphatase YjhB (NUDIX family)
MLKRFLGAAWRKMPDWVRRWTMRATNARFTVTAAAVIVNERSEVLLLKHLFRPSPGWGIPGGFVQANEQPHEALRRELREEVGLEIDELEIVSVRSFTKLHQLEIVFISGATGEVQCRSIEVERAAWFSTKSLPPGLPEYQRRLIERVVSDGASGCS